MAQATPDPVIVLYDLACTKGVCFSPVVWKIRLMLNFKRIPYRTIFLEFPDIAPTIRPLIPGEADKRYTVPVIHHLPTDTYIMDSPAIAEFIETTFPSPPVIMSSELGTEVEARARATGSKVMVSAVLPREVDILAPRAAQWFRSTREASLGRTLEEQLATEDEAWAAADAQLREVSDLLERNKDKGPYILGKDISYADMFIAGANQSTRMVHEGSFERFMAYPGFERIYRALEPLMEKNT